MKRKRSSRKAAPARLVPQQAPPKVQFWWWALVGAAVMALGLWLLWPSRPQTVKKPPADSAAHSPAPALSLLTNSVEALSANRASIPPGTQQEGAFLDLMNQANQLLGKGKPSEALEVLREAEHLNPNDEDIYYNMGIAFTRLNRNEEAAKAYEKAIELFPDYTEAHNNYGNLLVRMGKPDEAVKQFEEAVRITPEYPSALNNFGSALQRVGKTNQARECFEKAVKLDTNYWQAHFNLASAYAQEKRIHEARTELETVLRLQPDFPPAKQALQRLNSLTNAPLATP